METAVVVALIGAVATVIAAIIARNAAHRIADSPPSVIPHSAQLAGDLDDPVKSSPTKQGLTAEDERQLECLTMGGGPAIMTFSDINIHLLPHAAARYGPECRELTITGRVTDKHLEGIALFVNLESLEIVGENVMITSRAVNGFGMLQNLRRLELMGCHRIDDSCAMALATLSKLERLIISGAKRFTFRGLDIIARNLKKLERLEAIGCGVNWEEGERIQQMLPGVKVTAC